MGSVRIEQRGNNHQVNIAFRMDIARNLGAEEHTETDRNTFLAQLPQIVFDNIYN